MTNINLSISSSNENRTQRCTVHCLKCLPISSFVLILTLNSLYSKEIHLGEEAGKWEREERQPKTQFINKSQQTPPLELSFNTTFTRLKVSSEIHQYFINKTNFIVQMYWLRIHHQVNVIYIEALIQSPPFGLLLYSRSYFFIYLLT